jgi:hypothetical protein
MGHTDGIEHNPQEQGDECARVDSNHHAGTPDRALTLFTRPSYVQPRTKLRSSVFLDALEAPDDLDAATGLARI